MFKFSNIVELFYPDQKIARGIFNTMNSNSVSNISFTEEDDESYLISYPQYSFLLDGFNITIRHSSTSEPSFRNFAWLSIDDVDIRSNNIINIKIWKRITDISNNPEKDIVRKDAMIHFGGK